MTDWETTFGNVSTPLARQIMPQGEPEKIKPAVAVTVEGEGTEESFRIMEKLKSPVRPVRVLEATVKGKGDNTQAVLARGFAPGLVKKPHIDSLLHSAYYTIRNELERLQAKSEREGLSSTEAQQFERYINSLRKLATEEREQREADKVDAMSDDEIRQKIREMENQ